MGQMFKVEMRFASGWGDAEWTEDDKPLRFATRKEAEEAINEHILTQHEAVKAGHMSDKYKRSDYRIVAENEPMNRRVNEA